ncbi:mucin-2 isoform X2 [Coregonus clupeaformis]|uniref:mucin-2 isoform X2 n=1 Tax=Coregonus clupeaformis TaxID=59861 RepID=UPI001E1C824E|nr:mucin-2 isoform X2 [Coregonus clupeaformis]
MTLRGPSAHPGARRGQAPGWRRSGEQSDWDGLMSEAEVVPRHTGLTGRNPPRPQSANLDGCLQELERVQSQTYFKGGSPVSSPGQVPNVELVPPSPPRLTPARAPRPQSAIEGRRQMNEWLHELERMQSGDYFGGSPTGSPEVEPRQTVHLGRTPRPQSAIEGGSQNLDRWLRELERMENGRYFGNPDRVQRDQAQAPFYDRTASMPTLHKEPVGSGLRHHYQGLPSSSSLCSRDRDLSPCGTPSLCDSSLGSQESLRAGLSSSPDHRGSWERAIIKQAPGNEQAKLSSLTPVRVGWLPIQRRALLRDAPAPGPGHPHLQVNPASQVRLKPAITPTFLKNPVKGNGITPVEGDVEKVERCQPSINTVGLRTRWLPVQDPPPCTQHQVSGKESSVPRERDNRSLGWPDLRRCWANRTLPHLSGSGTPTQSNNPLPGANTNSEPGRKSPLHRTTSTNQQPSHIKVTPYGTRSQSPDIQTGDDSDSGPCWRYSLSRTNSFQITSTMTIRPTVQENPSQSEVTPSGTNSAAPYRSNSPLYRTNSVQQRPSHAEVTPHRTSSETYRATSLHKRTSSLPQPSPAGVVSPPASGSTTGPTTVLKTTTPVFPSITITSKKISRTASLPGSRAPSPQTYHSDETRVPGYKTPSPQSYHSDETRVPGYKTPSPQSYHSDETRVPGYKTTSPQSYHSDETRVPGYKAPRPQSYHSDEARVPGYKAPSPQSYHTNQARVSTTCTSVTQQDQDHHHHPAGTDPSSTPVTLRRKATATTVKVTEHRRMNSEPVNRLNGRQSHVSSVSGDQPNDQGTVVRRRKATVIKVTEHRESYCPGRGANGGSSSGRPSEYRHSYTEGVYRQNSLWQQGAMNSPTNSMESLQSTTSTPSQCPLESSMDRIDWPNSALFLTPNKPTSTTTVALRDPEGSGGGGKPIQKSTLMLFINPPSPSFKQTSIEKVGGERWTRDRPVSCYANVFGHTDPTEPCLVPETVTVTQAGPRHWSPETVTVTQAGPRHWSPETVTVTQPGPRHWSTETVTVTQAGPRHWSPETVTVTQAGPRHWSPETVTVTQAGPRHWSPETVTVTQAGPRNWSPETVTVTQAGPRHWSPETVTVTQAGPRHWSPETVTVTQAGPRHWSPETVTVTQAGPRHWSMGLLNQTQNTNIDPARDWAKDTAASNSRLNTGSSSSSISAGPACRDRETCPPEAESSRPEGSGTEREGDLPPHPHQADVRSSEPQPSAFTLIKPQEPTSHQRSPEEVLALNAAAIIANIKLQRQRSLKKTTHDLSTRDSRSSTSPEGKTLVKDAGGCVRPRTDDNSVRLDPVETTRTTHPRTDDNSVRLDPVETTRTTHPRTDDNRLDPVETTRTTHPRTDDNRLDPVETTRTAHPRTDDNSVRLDPVETTRTTHPRTDDNSVRLDPVETTRTTHPRTDDNSVRLDPVETTRTTHPRTDDNSVRLDPVETTRTTHPRTDDNSVRLDPVETTRTTHPRTDDNSVRLDPVETTRTTHPRTDDNSVRLDPVETTRTTHPRTDDNSVRLDPVETTRTTHPRTDDNSVRLDPVETTRTTHPRTDDNSVRLDPVETTRTTHPRTDDNSVRLDPVETTRTTHPRTDDNSVRLDPVETTRTTHPRTDDNSVRLDPVETTRTTHPRTDDNSVRLDPVETTRTIHPTTQTYVGFIPLNPDSDPETSKANIPSPREALERSRPDFISRSQGRLREMERRAEERREERYSDHQPDEMMLRHHRRGHSTRASPLSDNLFRPRHRAITGKEMQLRTRKNYKNLPEVKRKQEEQKRREDYLTNRLRADMFKKKLLEQTLQRGSH